MRAPGAARAAGLTRVIGAQPAAPSVNLSEDEVLERLEDYFSSGSFTTAIGKFAADHAHELEFAPITEEQPLKCVTRRPRTAAAAAD